MVKYILSTTLTKIFGWKNYCVCYYTSETTGNIEILVKRLYFPECNYIRWELRRRGFNEAVIKNAFRVS